jgi:hypothetical protein
LAARDFERARAQAARLGEALDRAAACHLN